LVILNWLTTYPGGTWQERWQAVEALHEGKWAGVMVTELAADTRHERGYLSMAVGTLIQVGLLRPGYHALRSMQSGAVHERVRDLVSPELFASAEAAGARLGMPPVSIRLSLTVLTSIVIGTGKTLEEVTTEDLLEFCACWTIPVQEIIANLTERIDEANANGWLGEIEGLKTSQTAAIAKLASMNRAESNRPGFSELSDPIVRRSQGD
jgi:hypothetical protein